MAQPNLNGRDTITGTNGDDVLKGGNGKDRLFGLDGNDWLDGGHGNDTHNGGSGADRFALAKAGGSDVVSDFSGPSITTEQITISFDDLPVAMIPDGYAGLNWNNIYTLEERSPPESGYDNAATSGVQIAFNGFGEIGTIDNASDFNLVKGNFTAAWNNDLNVTVSAWDNGVVVDTEHFTIDTTGPTPIAFNFTSIDMITFESFGGTDAGFGSGSGTHFAMDDLVIEREVVVPNDVIALVGGTADDIATAVAGVTANGAGDAVVSYAGANMTLVGIAPDAVTADYFVIA
jgi:hypothetical protein